MEDYLASVKAGIQHIGSRDADRAIEFLKSGFGSRLGCLGSVSSHARAKSLLAWFDGRDLAQFKTWAFIAAKIERMQFQILPGEWFPAYYHLYALISDHQDIMDWFLQHRVSYFLEGVAADKDNPQRPSFHGYQAILALNAEWGPLARRCEQILSADLTKDRKYLVDHRFYLALAQGDKPAMEAALNELTSPKVAKVRNIEHAFGFTEKLIATHATIYAKIAWRHGYQVEIDSPWVPKEWLPIAPLDHYDEPWDFMKSFDIWQPFEGDWAPWSPKRPPESVQTVNSP